MTSAPRSARRTVGAVVCLLAMTASHAAEVRISVAVSFKPVAEALLVSEATSAAPVWNAGGSSILVQQLLRGAPGDLIVTAGAMEMDRLERAGALAPGTRAVLARNRLVLAVPAGSGTGLSVPGSIREIGDGRVGRIAVGNPRTAPLGRYTAALLERAELSETFRGRTVYAENARIALEYVARGDVDAGIVYSTDVALADGRVRSIDLFPPRIQPEIVYEAAVLRDAAQPDAARAVLSRLASPTAQSELRRRGWLVPETSLLSAPVQPTLQPAR